MIEGKTILLTGGTGTFGGFFLEHALRPSRLIPPKAIRVYSRDELKQSELREQFSDCPNLRFFIGDVRDRDRLHRAAEGCDIIVHAAALKQVPSCEYNPLEAIKTNILGSQNVIDVALDLKISRTLLISSDKAVNPINIYGATKLCAEKLFIHANAYAGPNIVRFSCVRYGNVMGSRGSVLELFARQAEKHGRVSVTDERATRFFLSRDTAVELVLYALSDMCGGEIYVPKVPSHRIADLAKDFADDEGIAFARGYEITGLRPGEKLHEILITSEEAQRTEYRDREQCFVIHPRHTGASLGEGFVYTSEVSLEEPSSRI